MIDFIISYTFYEKFTSENEKMNEIYVIIGFEVSTRVTWDDERLMIDL